MTEFGGDANVVIWIGDTLRRPMPARPDHVHALLRHFEARGWAGAPRFLGTGEEGGEILSWVEGTVVEPGLAGAPGTWTEGCLAALGGLVRRMQRSHRREHAGGDGGDRDLAPRNTVLRRRDPRAPLRPVAIIDWDRASPGARIDDLACMCWLFRISARGEVDADVVAHSMAVICDACGPDDRSTLLESVISSQERCWRGTEAAAAAGRRLTDGGSRQGSRPGDMRMSTASRIPGLGPVSASEAARARASVPGTSG